MQWESLSPTKNTYAGLFLLTLATLMFEVLLTRIFSVTMWYHFAFVAISVAMFGMSVGAILVYLLPRYFIPERTREHLARSALWFGITAFLAFLAHAKIPFLPERSLVGIASISFTYLVISIPFVFSGICVCLALTRFPRHIGKLYAADLCGGALGCVLLLYSLDVTDAAGVVLLVAVLASLAALCFGYDSANKVLRQAAWMYSACFICFACAQTISARDGFPLIHLSWSKGELESASLYEKWNSFSRIRVYGDRQRLEVPFGWGLSPTYELKPSIRQLSLDIDSDALTVLTAFDGDYKPLEYLKYDVTNMAYYVRHNGNVLVMGAGGGRDVLSALVFGQKSVLAVELNENILKMVNEKYGDFTGHLDRVPRVRFVNDEARSYATRTNERFDIIQISMVDTWAATAAGAFVLSEHSLYTVEAWKTLLDHLLPGGILSVSRWSFGDRSGEVYRMVSLAAASLKKLSIRDARNHIVILRRKGTRQAAGVPIGVATLLLSRDPFSGEDLKTLESVSRQLDFDFLLSPGFAADSTFATLASGDLPKEFSNGIQLNLAPSTDDNPFFFVTIRPVDFWKPAAWHAPGLAFNIKAMFVLAVLLVTVILLTVLCIFVPLMLGGQRNVLRGSWPLLMFFAAIGLGFMLVEVSQMQRLMIFLGHPSYALSVVLFVLLISCGLGSFCTERIGRGVANGRTLLLPLLVLLTALFIFGKVTPFAMATLAGAKTPIRILAASAILFPLGFFMGMAFPLGMRLASFKSAALTPWLWGVNGATSVCASVLGMAIAVGAGISASFWTGFFCYCAAFLAFLIATRSDAVTPNSRERQSSSMA